MISFDRGAGPRLLLFPASLRRNSYQRLLVDYFEQSLRRSCCIDVLEAGDVELPIYNQDLESDPAILKRVIDVRARFAGAEALIVASPEYNAHVSPYLKNTLDWVSRLARIDARFAADNVFRGRPVMLACASTGWTGGVLGLQDARTIFSYLGCLVAPEQICVSDAEHWARSGTFQFERPFADFIASALAEFLALVERSRSQENFRDRERSRA